MKTVRRRADGCRKQSGISLFNLFRGAKTSRSERLTEVLHAPAEIVHTSARLIESQIALSEGSLSRSKVFDTYTSAYIFGFVEAMLAKAGVDGEMAAKVLIARTFMRIFGNEVGSKIMGKCLRAQSDPDFQSARYEGANEAMIWLASDGSDVPLRLTHYLNGT